MQDSNLVPDKKLVVGGDVGFAQTKLSCPEKNINVTIPSAVAEPQHAMAGIGCGQKLFVLDGGKYVFGHDALVPGSKQIQSLDEEWLLKYMPGLICAAAAAAGLDLHEVGILSTGLPIEMWRRHQNLAKEILQTIHCNGETYTFDRIDVRPQGVGALGYHTQLGAPADECGLVVDIGGNTVLAVRYDQLRPIGTNTRQYNELGVLSVARALTPFLSEMSGGRTVTEIKAMKAIRDRKYLAQDIGTQIDSTIDSYAERLLANLRSDYRDIIPELDRLVVAGGGAYLVGEALRKEYPRVTVLAEPEYANVRGYAYLSGLSI